MIPIKIYNETYYDIVLKNGEIYKIAKIKIIMMILVLQLINQYS